MSNQTRVVRALIVEDDEWQAHGIKSDLANFSEDQKKRLGISHFESDEAGSVTEAKQLLAAAGKAPYDLLFLDLSLSLNKGDQEESSDAGFELVEFVRKRGGAREIIVVSLFADYLNMTKAFRGGALDFIAKPFARDNLQTRIIECWKRVLAKDSDRIFEHITRQRIKDLVPFYRQELGHQFSACFSRLIQTVMYVAEEMESEFGERLGLDAKREPQDSLIRHLSELEEAVGKAKQEWTELYSSLSSGGAMTKQFVVEELLCQIRYELLPCLLVKGVELEIPQVQKTVVLSFQDDVYTVIREIIVGALSELPDYSDPSLVRATVTIEEEHAQVRFSGDLFRIEPEVASAIEKGERQPDKIFGRVWGLSVAQYIALRGGGRLRIGGEENPDSVTYQIPLARHA